MCNIQCKEMSHCIQQLVGPGGCNAASHDADDADGACIDNADHAGDARFDDDADTVDDEEAGNNHDDGESLALKVCCHVSRRAASSNVQCNPTENHYGNYCHLLDL